ncbi:MAG: TPM domain-containing protein [Rhodocyclaceae bacterium]|nr:TPM domain-containing protein [Rhodocyclaceae bacterium]MBK9624022.1 TPM domain-containing protein [Rhodocyclaceae bacterium]
MVRNIQRTLKHLTIPDWFATRVFSARDLAAITLAVKQSEATHRGELRFVIEGALPLSALWQKQTAHQRAIQLFSELRVWDTADNSGILIYIQLVDRRVEILADRGINARVAQSEWDKICRAMEQAFRAQQWRAGAVNAINRASDLLAQHFPAREDNPNELPDAPLVI